MTTISDGHLKRFHKYWENATSDNDLTLYGFRRFKTTHLLNLRFIEAELAELDAVMYQAGLSLGIDHSPLNRLGLQYCQKDANVKISVTDDLILRLRELTKQ
ncbi:hypothetical protein F5883DRAFT_442334 [Diaporthe sp. PMI_573]|nr:hypothetical protein F5883DRAFT_442334 [Diaporthaceae sp. PMI_573]